MSTQERLRGADAAGSDASSAQTAKPEPLASNHNTVTLKHPVKFGNKQYVELTFPTTLKGRHVRRFQVDANGVPTAGMYLNVAADATGVDDAVIDNLEGEDVAAVIARTIGLLQRGGFVGTTSETS